eukprot:252570-Amphidinium_carterae.1
MGGVWAAVSIRVLAHTVLLEHVHESCLLGPEALLLQLVDQKAGKVDSDALCKAEAGSNNRPNRTVQTPPVESPPLVPKG